MQIKAFSARHTSLAFELACRNYAEERAAVPALPDVRPAPPQLFAENGLGVAALEEGRMLGFLGCYEPWENAFTGTARGTFSPIEAHGAVPEQREKIYRLLYQAAAEKWVEAGIASHSIALYAHDDAARRAFFTCGFGLRCVDAVRGMDEVHLPSSSIANSSIGTREPHGCPVHVEDRSSSQEIRAYGEQSQDAAPHSRLSFQARQTAVYAEAGRDELPLVAPLGVLLARHLAASPCFMCPSREETDASWLARREERGSRVFTAAFDGTIIAFLEITSDGENFATLSPGMANVCGAYCLPEFRRQGVMPRLLNCAVRALRREGYLQLGVDYESFNLAAQGFWPKYFTPYTYGVVRRIDENIFMKHR